MAIGAAAVAALALLTAFDPAGATIMIIPSPDFPDTMAVGETFGASLDIGNFSTFPDNTTARDLSLIDLVPACSNAVTDCSSGVETGVFQLSATGLGTGPAGCAGTWTIFEVGPGTFRFEPPGGEGSLVLAEGEFCVIDFTASTLRVPTVDIGPAPGVQTAQVACATASDPSFPVRSCGSDQATVLQGVPSLSTAATTTVPLGGAINDTASLTGPPLGDAPTGSIQFEAYPAGTGCSGSPAFIDAVPVTGFGDYVSNPFVPGAAGDYNWVATYTGDVNYLPAFSPCGAPGETSTVTAVVVQPTIVTAATPTATFGDPVSDVATLSGGAGPTGTITFNVFGPNDPTCSSIPVASSVVPVSGNGAYDSGPFVPAVVGIYQWVASYSGDANNFPASTACGDPGGTTIVSPAVPTLSTQATPAALLGEPISDTATVAGPAPVPPIGSVTFSVFGPDDASCSGSPIFTDVPQSVGGGPPPTATSNPFVPPAAGTYRWVAAYSGDGNHVPVISACNDANETSTVTVGPPAMVVDLTASPPSQPAPGGIFTFDVLVMNTGGGSLTILSVTDDIYGDLATFPGSDCSTAPGTVLPPGGVYTCTFEATFTGAAGDSQTDTVSVLAEDPLGIDILDSDPATVAIGFPPSLTTQATPSAFLGGAIIDTATIEVGPDPPEATGTITFTVFGPNDPSCSGTPAFSSTNALDLGGSAVSDPFVPASAGSYHWIAAYNGDAVYLPISGSCGDPGEISMVNQGVVSLTTDATPTADVGDPITDVAVLTGPPAPPAPMPTGFIVFTVFVPSDPGCSAPGDTLSVPVTGFGSYQSPEYVPTGPGEYRWIASYTGDANYAPVSGACNDPGEASTVTLTASLSTQATPSADVGEAISDTATVSGLPFNPPTGTVTFRAFGPADASCAGPPAFDSGPQPLRSTTPTSVPLPPTAQSGAFTPTAAGTYLWVATYNGDSDYPVVSGACGDSGEVSAVAATQPEITTFATPTATVGQPISDTADLSGGFDPTGTITFTVFGPDDVACTGAPASSTTVSVAGNGDYTSAPFRPTAPGAYRWVAGYAGDAANQAASTACNDPGETSSVFAALTIDVTSSVSPASLPEPGGEFAYTYTVTNSHESLTLAVVSLVDDVFGNLSARGTCAAPLGIVLPPGRTSTCGFTAPLNGNAGSARTNTVTVVGGFGALGTATDSSQTTVSLTDVPPTISVDEDASPASLPEPGGDFSFSVRISNTSAEAVTITSVVNDVYGNLATRAGSTCFMVPRVVVAPGGTRACEFTGPFSGGGGASQVDTVTATAVDDDGSQAAGSDQMQLTLTPVAREVPFEEPPEPGEDPPEAVEDPPEAVEDPPVVTVTTAPPAVATTVTTAPIAPSTTTPTRPTDLTLDPPVIGPGGTLVVTGRGCDPNAAVTLYTEGEVAGTALADGSGEFRTTARPPKTDVGRFQLVAECGPTLTAPFDIVLAGQLEAGTSTFIVLLFVLLLALVFASNRILDRGGRYAR